MPAVEVSQTAKGRERTPPKRDRRQKCDFIHCAASCPTAAQNGGYAGVKSFYGILINEIINEIINKDAKQAADGGCDYGALEGSLRRAMTRAGWLTPVKFASRDVNFKTDTGA